MASSFKCLVKPHIHNFYGQVAAEETAPKTKNIAVVVTATHFRGIGLGGMHRANSGNAVGHHAHPDTAPANQNASVAFPFSYGPSYSCRIIRVVDGIDAVGAEVFHLMMQNLKMGRDDFFQIPPCMVTSNYYLHKGSFRLQATS